MVSLSNADSIDDVLTVCVILWETTLTEFVICAARSLKRIKSNSRESGPLFHFVQRVHLKRWQQLQQHLNSLTGKGSAPKSSVSNLAKHLSDKRHDFFEEFKGRQVIFYVCITSTDKVKKQC